MHIDAVVDEKDNHHTQGRLILPRSSHHALIHYGWLSEAAVPVPLNDKFGSGGASFPQPRCPAAVSLPPLYNKSHP